MRVEAVVRRFFLFLLCVPMFLGSAEAAKKTCAVAIRADCLAGCNRLNGRLTQNGNGSFTCEYLASQGPKEWYVLTGVGRDYESLARTGLSTFTDQQDLRFGDAQARTATYFGIGGAFPVNDWVSIDVGLSSAAGKSTARAVAFNPATGVQSIASVTNEYRIYAADVGARMYLYQRPRFKHWIYIGALSALADPTSGSLTRNLQTSSLSREQFRSTTTLEPVAGVGLTVPFSSRANGNIIVRHGPRSGLYVAFALSVPIPDPPQFDVPAEFN